MKTKQCMGSYKRNTSGMISVASHSRVDGLNYSSVSEHAVFCHHYFTNSNTIISERGEVVPILCPGDLSAGV